MAPNLVCVIGIREGTGGAIARRFAREGRIACVTHRSVDQFGPLLRLIRDEGVLNHRFACNTRKGEDMIVVVEKIERAAARRLALDIDLYSALHQ